MNAIAELCPSGVVSLGVVDTDTDLRLVLHKEANGARTADRTVGPTPEPGAIYPHFCTVGSFLFVVLYRR